MSVSSAIEPVRLVGRVEVDGEGDWAEGAWDHEDFLQHSLAEAGVPVAEIQTVALIRNEGRWEYDRIRRDMWKPLRGGHTFGNPEEIAEALEAGSEDIKTGVLSRLRDWFAGREYEVLDEESSPSELILFVLSAPAVPGCEAHFARSETVGGNLSWKVTILGTGVTGLRKLSVSVSSEFTAAAGETKAVFVPVTIRIQRVLVRQEGVTIGTGLVKEPVFAPDATPGLRIYAEGNSLSFEEPALRLFPLRQDVATSASKYELKLTRTKEYTVELGFKALGMDHSISATEDLVSEAAFSCELSGGHDYLLHRFTELPGITWKVKG
jgi:hypothetical protein